jgi:hypothetical protein
MEIIQNADDNEYPKDTTPTVSITVFPKHVEIGCNEVGFSRENILALCRTCRSSKPPGQGYTGEKGIGFKSVFKLANRAHIRSQPYYFQLDQRRDLGMVTPQWDELFFDDHKVEYQTTIVLDHICDESRNFSNALEKDLGEIDPALILFLRRIQRIHLTLFDSSCSGKPVIKKRFRRDGWTPGSGVVSLIDEDTRTMYHFYKHPITIDFDGTEPRREYQKNTEVILAFPVNTVFSKYAPLIRKKNLVFAYLPIGDLGFKVR